MIKINDIFKYSALAILLFSFIIELFIVGIVERGGILSLQYLILFIFYVAFFVFNKPILTVFFKRLLIFLVLIIFLGLFSSDLVITYNYIAKFTFGLLFFIVGYNLFHRMEDLQLLFKFSIVMLTVGLAIVFYNNAMGSGISLYDNDFFGQSKSNTYNVFSIIISFLFSQIVFYTKKQKIALLVLSFFTLLMLLMVFKRTPFLVLAISTIIILYFNLSFKNFKRIISGLLVLSALFIYFYPYYEAQLNKNIVARQKNFEQDLTEEGRYQENFAVFDKIKTEPLLFVFGTFEVFNSRDKSFLDDRMLHNDYSNILWSSGFLGFFLYFGNMFSLLVTFLKNRIRQAKDDFYSNISVSGIVVVLCYFICAMGQAWTSITILGIVMLYSGFCIRVITVKNNK